MISKRGRFGLKVYELCASTGPATRYTTFFQGVHLAGPWRHPLVHNSGVSLDGDGSFLGLRYLLFVDDRYTSPSLSYVAGLSVEGPQHHPHAVISSYCYSGCEEKPSVVVDYCVSMKDVDVTDQMVNYYATTHQSKL